MGYLEPISTLGNHGLSLIFSGCLNASLIEKVKVQLPATQCALLDKVLFPTLNNLGSIVTSDTTGAPTSSILKMGASSTLDMKSFTNALTDGEFSNSLAKPISVKLTGSPPPKK
jgi:hypothetical protein